MSDNDDIEVDSDVSIPIFRFFYYCFLFFFMAVCLLACDLAELAAQLGVSFQQGWLAAQVFSTRILGYLWEPLACLSLKKIAD